MIQGKSQCQTEVHLNILKQHFFSASQTSLKMSFNLAFRMSVLCGWWWQSVEPGVQIRRDVWNRGSWSLRWDPTQL